MKKNIKIIFWLYFSLFFLLILNLIKFKLFDSKDIISNSYNPRLSGIESTIKRGTIYDRNGEVLAYSEKSDGEDGSYIRKYNYPRQFCHILGFTSNGKSGVESKYNFYLETLHNELLQRISGVFRGTELCADSVHLTLDKNLQLKASELLGKNKGAIVVTEPDTGKILAMVSYPDFDPEAIAENWQQLKDDDENSPLINRASQGLYPPGSVFKMITAASALENIEDIKSYRYNCEGEAYFGDNKIRCFNSKAHGNISLTGAFAYSCNTFFAETGIRLGGGNLRENAENAFFNRELGYELEYNKSTFELKDGSSQSEILETAIGQGKTLVTPLHIAMITSAVGNNGIMMKPYVLDYTETYNGKIKNKKIPETLGQIFKDTDTAYEITEMMKKVVEEGTGVQAKINGISVAGKTGTAENASGKDHAWFTAFAPADKPKVCVTVVLENAGTGSNAVPAARELIETALKED